MTSQSLQGTEAERKREMGRLPAIGLPVSGELPLPSGLLGSCSSATAGWGDRGGGKVEKVSD